MSRSLLTRSSYRGGSRRPKGFSINEVSCRIMMIPRYTALHDDAIGGLKGFVRSNNGIIFVKRVTKFMSTRPDSEIGSLRRGSVRVPFGQMDLVGMLRPRQRLDVSMFPLSKMSPTEVGRGRGKGRTSGLFCRVHRSKSGG